MNENLNLIKILKYCPSGTKLYSTVLGEVELDSVENDDGYPIKVLVKDNTDSFTKEGKLYSDYEGECVLFPSKEQRDWSKFKVKKECFDPNTLNPFDKVLIRDSKYEDWRCDIFSHIPNKGNYYFRTITSYYAYCIPYNDETKYLVGKTEEAPVFYRYWED